MPFSQAHSDLSTCSAERLVSLVQSGDDAALEELTRCFGQRLVGAARRVCGNLYDADDAVQDALLSASENLTSFRGEGSLEGWLVRMVVHACKRMHRGQKNNPALHSTGIELESEDDPEMLSAQGEMVGQLGEALLTLGAEDRAILLLAEADGWTGTEIGGALGMTPVAVRSRLMRARLKLREQLLAVQGGDACSFESGVI